MMRSAAERAGIRSNALMLSLEPEAAAILCWRDAVRQGRIDDAVSVGDCFMVIDAGAGTVDISVHELDADRSLKQVAKPYVRVGKSDKWTDATSFAVAVEDLGALVALTKASSACLNLHLDALRLMNSENRLRIIGAPFCATLSFKNVVTIFINKNEFASNSAAKLFLCSRRTFRRSMVS